MQYTIIVNPTSGKGTGLSSIPQIRSIFNQAGVEYNIIQTEYPGHAIKLAYEHGKASDHIISAGGDGTSNEIINGLMQLREETGNTPILGVIPVGRGNDFAYGMGIPMGVEPSCEVVLHGKSKKTDIGLVYGDNFPKGRYFGNGVGVGFDAVVGFVAAKSKLRGFLSYIVAAIKTIFIYYKAPLMEVATDRETFQITALMISIMNGKRMGGGFYMAPESDPCDNLFDLCCVEQVSKARIFPLMTKFFSGSQGGHPAVRFIQGSKVTIKALKGSLPAHADGETVCTEGSEIRIELLPHPLEVLTVV